jgi:hypothetical protein
MNDLPSFVRSATMDRWTVPQFEKMRLGGKNQAPLALNGRPFGSDADPVVPIT